MKMSMTNVLFKPNGRIEQGQFWAGWAVIVAGNIIANLIPLLGILISIGLIYVGCCVYGKRLHDMGRSAWLIAIPWVTGIVLSIIGLVMAFPQLMEVAESDPQALEDPMQLMSALGPMFGFILVANLIWLAFTIWVGVGKSDPNDNQYGPGPGGAGQAFV